MRWFEGGIPQAIQKAKSNKAVFIVFVAGEDDKSREMESYLHKDEVTGVCEENNCVAVKLDANSNECKFFSQIYPVVVIPSSFFIGDTGVPLEVIGECKSQEDFLIRVKKAIDLQNGSTQGESSGQVLSQQPLAAQSQPQTTTQIRSPEPAEATSEDINSQVYDEEPVGGTVAAAAEGSGSAGSGDDVTLEQKTSPEETDKSLDEKVERAKVLVELKREEKMKKEADDAKRKEMERRVIGQGVQKLRQQQKEADLLEAKKELKKDREEDKLARQRVREDIERDRLEKAARFGREKDERAKAAEEAKKKKLLEQQAVQAEEQARRSDIARIQFRMADGSSVTHQFPATDTFASVHQFITQHVGSEVSLSMTFPRRTFTLEDHNLTLQELQLAPSAAILVIPGRVSTSTVRSSSGIFSISGITQLVFAPFWFVWNLIASLLGLSRASSSGGGRPSRQQQASGSTASGGERNRGGAYKRPASSSRQEGSVRRFRNSQDDEDDDDRNTWNGNSTQQM